VDESAEQHRSSVTSRRGGGPDAQRRIQGGGAWVQEFRGVRERSKGRLKERSMQRREISPDEQVDVQRGEAPRVRAQGVSERAVGRLQRAVEGERRGVGPFEGWQGQAVEELDDGKALRERTPEGDHRHAWRGGGHRLWRDMIRRI